MNKQEAEIADSVLRCFATLPNRSITPIQIEWLSKELEVSYQSVYRFIKLFIADGYLAPVDKRFDFKVYRITDIGLRFIRFDGGYTHQARYERYKNQNVRFTWIRHWAWFFAFVASFIINLYFLLS